MVGVHTRRKCRTRGLDGAGIKYDGSIHRVPFRPTQFVGREEKRKKKKMNKRYLPAIAAFLILAIASASFMPVFAVTVLRARADPTLVVVTIPEDDELRKTGIIVLAKDEADFRTKMAATTRVYTYQDLLAQYKLLVSYNGQPIRPTLIACQVIEKDKVNPIKNEQGTWENLKTDLVDQTGNFVCKFRWGKVGVGVVDVYYKGEVNPQYLSDYVVVILAAYTVGRTTIYGTEIQDVCVLGWPVDNVKFSWTKPDGDFHWDYADPLGEFVSCEDATMYQKHHQLGLPVPWS